MSETIKESKAQRAERLKGALNPWSALGGGHAHAGGPRRLHRAEHDGRHSRSFRQCCAAHTDEELRNILAGELVEAVERGVAPARPPHGVDG